MGNRNGEERETAASPTLVPAPKLGHSGMSGVDLDRRVHGSFLLQRLMSSEDTTSSGWAASARDDSSGSHLRDRLTQATSGWSVGDDVVESAPPLPPAPQQLPEGAAAEVAAEAAAEAAAEVEAWRADDTDGPWACEEPIATSGRWDPPRRGTEHTSSPFSAPPSLLVGHDAERPPEPSRRAAEGPARPNGSSRSRSRSLSFGPPLPPPALAPGLPSAGSFRSSSEQEASLPDGETTDSGGGREGPERPARTPPSSSPASLSSPLRSLDLSSSPPLDPLSSPLLGSSSFPSSQPVSPILSHSLPRAGLAPAPGDDNGDGDREDDGDGDDDGGRPPLDRAGPSPRGEAPRAGASRGSAVGQRQDPARREGDDPPSPRLPAGGSGDRARSSASVGGSRRGSTSLAPFPGHEPHSPHPAQQAELLRFDSPRWNPRAIQRETSQQGGYGPGQQQPGSSRPRQSQPCAPRPGQAQAGSVLLPQAQAPGPPAPQARAGGPSLPQIPRESDSYATSLPYPLRDRLPEGDSLLLPPPPPPPRAIPSPLVTTVDPMRSLGHIRKAYPHASSSEPAETLLDLPPEPTPPDAPAARAPGQQPARAGQRAGAPGDPAACAAAGPGGHASGALPAPGRHGTPPLSPTASLPHPDGSNDGSGGSGAFALEGKVRGGMPRSMSSVYGLLAEASASANASPRAWPGSYARSQGSAGTLTSSLAGVTERGSGGDLEGSTGGSFGTAPWPVAAVPASDEPAARGPLSDPAAAAAPPLRESSRALSPIASASLEAPARELRAAPSGDTRWIVARDSP